MRPAHPEDRPSEGRSSPWTQIHRRFQFDSQSQDSLSPLLLLDTHVLLPPRLGEHLHLVSRAADLPLPPRPPVRVPEANGDGRVKHLLEVLLRQCRALDVRHRAHFLRQRSGVLLQHGALSSPRQLDQHFDVLAQVTLGAHQEDGSQRAAPSDLGDPFLPDVLKGRGADDAEAEQQGVGPTVAEVSQFVELVLMETETGRSERVHSHVG